MLRRTSVFAFLLLVLTVAAAFAAPLVLSDQRAGWSLTLPEGWAAVPQENMAPIAVQGAGIFGIEDLKNVTALGGILVDQAAASFRMVAVVSYPLDALDKDGAADARAIGKGDKRNLGQMRQTLLDAAAETGTKVLDSQEIADGICISTSGREPDMPAGQVLHTRTCIRVIKDTGLLLVGLYTTATDPDKFDGKMTDLLDSLRIAK